MVGLSFNKGLALDKRRWSDYYISDVNWKSNAMLNGLMTWKKASSA